VSSGPIGRENGPATDRLHRAVTEGRLEHPEDPRLDAHVEGSMLRETRRGVRVDKPPGPNNDGVVALLMALDRIEQNAAAPTRVIGWVA